MKRIKNLRLGIIVMAFVVTAGCLFGGQAITNKLKVNDPLKRELHKVKAVRDYSVKQEKDGITIVLELQKVANLQKVLDVVRQKVQLYYGAPVKTFKIEDRRNACLEELRYQLSFYLEEAAASGHYIQLKEALESYHGQGIKARAYVSRSHIYVQLEKGPNYLYEAVPVAKAATAVNNNSGGEFG